MRTVICAGCLEKIAVDETTFYRNKRWCFSPECKNVIDEKVKNMNFARRAKKIQNGKFRSGVSKDLREMILQRDDNFCIMCHFKSSDFGIMQVHHITPASKGGSDDPNNLITLCKPCHTKVHKKGWEAFVDFFEKNIEKMDVPQEEEQGRVIQFPISMG